MTTGSEAKHVSMTPEMLSVTRKALHDLLVETDHYLIGGHTSEPTDTDTCCDYHLTMWTRRNEEQKVLRARRDIVVAGLREIESHMDISTKGGRRG